MLHPLPLLRSVWPELIGTSSEPVIHLSAIVTEGMRIFLVEDTRDVGEAIVEQFARNGHVVDWETDGEAAAATLTKLLTI